MGCCSKVVPEDATPTRPVGCTDLPCLIVYVLFWGLLIFIAAFAFVYGNPERLVHGYDSFGNVCGMKNERLGRLNNSGMDMNNMSYLFFFDLKEMQQALQVCVQKCPDRRINSHDELKAFIEETGVNLCTYGFNYGEELEKMRRNRSSEQNITDLLHNPLGPCPPLPVYDSVPVINRCVPRAVTDLTEGVMSRVYGTLNGIEVVQQVLSDLHRTKWLLLAFAACALVVSFLMVEVIHYLATMFAWGFMIAVPIVGTVLSVLLWVTYAEIKYKLDLIPQSQLLETAAKNERAFLAFSIIVTIVTVILLILVIVLRSRVSIVIKLFEEASSCLKDMRTLLLQPFITIVVLFAFFIFWMLVMVWLATATHTGVKPTYGAMELESSTSSPVLNKREQQEANQTSRPLGGTGFNLIALDPTWVQYFWWVYVIALLWVSQFILACQQMVIAGAVSYWYFTKDKSEVSCAVGKSISKMVVYHLGSVAKGSFLITLFKIPRIILTYIQLRLKQYGEDNKCVNCCLKCCWCCFYMLEKFIKYLNHNAYTVIAIEGCNFCTAAGIAFETITANILQVAAINSVGDFILFLGKCIVTGIIGITSLLVLKQDEELHFYAIPVLLATIFAYFVAHCVFSVYEMVIDTLFLCFMEDHNKNSGVDEHDMYASESLHKYITVEATKSLKSREPQEEVEMEQLNMPSNA